MALLHPRMFHSRMLNKTGILLGLVLLFAMQVWADDPQAIEAPLENTSAPATSTLPPVPRSPTAVPAIPGPSVSNEIRGAELERQITEHIARSLEQEFEGAFAPNDNNSGGKLAAAILIPLFALFFIFGGPVILVIVLMTMHYRAKARRERIQSENIAQLLAAGRDVPLELLRGDEASALAEDNLRKGVRNIGLGVGLLIFLTLLMGISIGAVGFIMIGLGISQLVVWKLADNKTAQPRD